MGGFSTPTAAGGITRLSELIIDADKSWVLKAISRLAGLDVGQVRGDIWDFNLENHANLIVRRLPAAEEGKVLCSRGPGKPPFWAWVWEEAGGTPSLERFYPCLIDLTHDEGIVTPDKSQNEDAPITTWSRQSYEDAPADYIKRLTPALALVDAEAIVTPDDTYNKNATITSSYETGVA